MALSVSTEECCHRGAIYRDAAVGRVGEEQTQISSTGYKLAVQDILYVTAVK